MFQKIVNAVAILSLLLSGGLAGGAYFGYKYVTSEPVSYTHLTLPTILLE